MVANGDGHDANASIRVLIAGGGPAGLLAAHAFRKQGYTCTVFEQDAFHGSRPRDWNFGIYWAQDPLRACLPDHLIDRVVKEAQVDHRELAPEGVLPYYNYATGELIKDIPIPMQIRLHRINFLKLLAEDLDIKFSKRIQHIESDGTTVTATFEDGAIEQGNVLIGAEGAHSKVREFLLGKEKAALKTSPLIAAFTMAKLPADTAKIAYEQLHPRMYTGSHPDGTWRFSCVHDAFTGTEPGDWNFMFLNSWVAPDSYDISTKQDSATVLADLKSNMSNCAEPFKSIVRSIPDGVRCWHSRLTYWVTEPWDNRNGTVTLIGDAAHPMTFHRGQGFNNSVFDVSNLAQQVAEKGLLRVGGKASGIDAYEEEMWPRGKEAVISNLENSLAIHDWEGLQKSHLFVSGAKQVLVKSTAVK